MTRSSVRIFLVQIAFLLFPAAAHAMDRAEYYFGALSLKDISEVCVSFNSQGSQFDGLNNTFLPRPETEILFSQISNQLRTTGLPIYRCDGYKGASRPSSPEQLLLSIDVVLAPKDYDTMMYAVGLSMAQAVTLMRDPKIKLVARTAKFDTHIGEVKKGELNSAIQYAILRLVDDFSKLLRMSKSTPLPRE